MKRSEHTRPGLTVVPYRVRMSLREWKEGLEKQRPATFEPRMKKPARKAPTWVAPLVNVFGRATCAMVYVETFTKSEVRAKMKSGCPDNRLPIGYGQSVRKVA